MRAVHQPGEGAVGQRLGESYAVEARHLRQDRGPHHRIGVQRHHDEQPGLTAGEIGEGTADGLHGAAPRLPAVGRHQQDPAGGVVKVGEGRVPVVRRAPDRPAQGVDDRVPGDDDRRRGDTVVQQVVPCVSGGRQVEGRELRREPAVDLLGEGRVPVAGAQSRFEVHHGHPAVEGGQCPGERGRGVPLDEHRVRPFPPEQGAQPVEDAHGDVGEGLALAEDVEVVVGTDAEQRVHLVEQTAVLGGHRHGRPEERGPVERLDDGGHFDGLWSCSIDDHQSFHPSLLWKKRSSGTSESLFRGRDRHCRVCVPPPE
ncbi:hypothetical protein GCM10010448_24440 [Streptomyces glomeratus]|uniref:Uncharacterized protein n=1 Tax=Streptomyces glomeratus TaxID=284452 RepID=A0ABP6LGT4_9ACTN